MVVPRLSFPDFLSYPSVPAHTTHIMTVSGESSYTCYTQAWGSIDSTVYIKRINRCNPTGIPPVDFFPFPIDKYLNDFSSTLCCMMLKVQKTDTLISKYYKFYKWYTYCTVYILVQDIFVFNVFLRFRTKFIEVVSFYWFLNAIQKEIFCRA